ncbi:MAG: peptide-methionine (S)-S-oxide reductase MsrA [Spirochaetia bacterium]
MGIRIRGTRRQHRKTVVPLLAVLLAVALAPAAAAEGSEARATFAGGCFWCMEKPFDELEGVISTVSGYAGGHLEDPSYQDVTAGGSGHAEVVQVTYDPEMVSYETLLEVFWRNVDPFDAGGQFCDRGNSYRTGIFYHSAEQARLARRSKREMSRRFSRGIVTEIDTLEMFYPAEDYHQNYYKRNPVRYRFYRTSCGRDRRLEEVWGDEAGGYEITESR